MLKKKKKELRGRKLDILFFLAYQFISKRIEVEENLEREL